MEIWSPNLCLSALWYRSLKMEILHTHEIEKQNYHNMQMKYQGA